MPHLLDEIEQQRPGTLQREMIELGNRLGDKSGKSLVSEVMHLGNQVAGIAIASQRFFHGYNLDYAMPKLGATSHIAREGLVFDESGKIGKSAALYANKHKN